MLDLQLRYSSPLIALCCGQYPGRDVRLVPAGAPSVLPYGGGGAAAIPAASLSVPQMPPSQQVGQRIAPMEEREQQV